MKFSFSKRRITAICSILCASLAFAVFIGSLRASASANMNIEETVESVRIIVGSTGDSAPRGYENTRNRFLSELSAKAPSNTYAAVVSFDDYYTEEEINSLINERGLTLERIYMWTPGETGKLSLSIENNDINAAKQRFVEKMEGPLGQSSVVQSEVQNLNNGSLKIYAITIVAPAEMLKTLSETETMVASLDVKYNPDAEAYALQKGVSYSYVELPTKPDGAF